MRDNIQRWIRASMMLHFYASLQSAFPDNDFVLYAEGMPKARGYTKYDYNYNGTPNTREVPRDNFFELRVDGPELYKLSKGYWKILTEVNMLVSTHIGNDIYKQDRHCGFATSGFTDAVQISKVGDGGDIVGCLMLSMKAAARQKLVVSNFGQIHPVIPILQSTVEGHYVGYWSF